MQYKGKKEIEIDMTQCKGCGTCEEVAPEHFEMDPATECPIVKESVVEGQHEDLTEAETWCPAKCLHIKDI